MGNKAFDVTALGELLIDFTENGNSAQGNPILEANPGGAPCNVLAMLEKLGKKTAFIGKVGNDMFGTQLKNAVEEVGIDTRNLVIDNEVHTTLAFVHTHLFLLGMVMFLIVTFAIHQFHIEKQKHYRLFLILYHPGVLLTSLMLFLRGITQVNGNELTNTVNAMISGVSGIGHILTGIGLLLFLFILKASVKDA